MHIHLGLVHAVTAFASVIIVGFFWRVAAMHMHDTPIGKAMAFVY